MEYLIIIWDGYYNTERESKEGAFQLDYLHMCEIAECFGERVPEMGKQFSWTIHIYWVEECCRRENVLYVAI